jgi:aminomuconate-semialdehyde/2-hydroxymuconate-6-semialdehyde dehydrogenase
VLIFLLWGWLCISLDAGEVMHAVGVRPVSFELGGKNAGLTRSAFENCGQICLGTERVYVHRPIFDQFVAALKEKAEALIPCKMGPCDPCC